MKTHFIKTLNIENFKGFENLEVKSFKSVNLISGKNNVGKTALMEAISLAVNSKDPQSCSVEITKILRVRQVDDEFDDELEFNIFHKNSRKMLIAIDNKKLQISIVPNSSSYPDDNIEISINNQSRKFSENNLSIDRFFRRRNPKIRLENGQAINFISSGKTRGVDIATMYSRLSDLNKEKFIDESLNKFDDNILAFKQSFANNRVLLKLKTKDQEFPITLSSFGDGINRYIAILCAIWSNQNGYLFIDEVENGIHYSNYPKLWQLIFQASSDANCQIFATTHSKECIEEFNQQDDGNFIELYTNKHNIIKANPRDKTQLEYSLDIDSGVRGE